MTVEMLPSKLSGKMEKSFAYETLRLRLPDIITKIIDHVHRSWSGFDKAAREDSSDVINRLGSLKYDLEHNRALNSVCDGRPDNAVWNEILREETEANKGTPPSFFHTAWLYSECYIYRKIAEAFAFSASLRSFDWFGQQKSRAYQESLAASCLLAECVVNMVSDDQQPNQTHLSKLLKMSLWGNKCDLSISGGVSNSQKEDPLSQIECLDENVLLDDSAQVWQLLSQERASGDSVVCVDIVLDNSGYELVTDLVLCYYLLKQWPDLRVILHCKQLPWFVSDATLHDVHATLYRMASSSASSSTSHTQLQQVASYLQHQLFITHRLSLSADMFWTLPCSIEQMHKYDPYLFRQLEHNSNLLLFKGDLNYRKISQDRDWIPTHTFSPPFPVPLCAVRTLKADTVFGLSEEKVKWATDRDTRWMLSANFGVIHFMQPHKHIADNETDAT